MNRLDTLLQIGGSKEELLSAAFDEINELRISNEECKRLYHVALKTTCTRESAIRDLKFKVEKLTKDLNAVLTTIQLVKAGESDEKV